MKKELKRVAIICLSMFAIFIGIKIILESEKQIFHSRLPRAIEIHGSKLKGYHHGKKTWELEAKYIWSDSSKYVFNGEILMEGCLYDSNQTPSVDNIFAEKVRVNTRAKTVIARGKVMADMIQGESSDDHISISAKELRYFNSTKRAYLFDSVRLEKNDYTIIPQNKIDINTEKSIAYIEDPFLLISSEYTMTGDSMVIYTKEHRIHMSNIDMIREAQEVRKNEFDSREAYLRTTASKLTCNFMTYINDSNRVEIKGEGDLHIAHGEKNMYANSGYYNKEENYFELEGEVLIEMPSIRWIFSEEKQAFSNVEIEEGMDKEVKIMTDKCVFNADLKQIHLQGNVIIKHPSITITSDSIILDDKKNIIILEGNVEVRKEKNSLLGDHLIYDIENETFVANKGVVSEFFIK